MTTAEHVSIPPAPSTEVPVLADFRERLLWVRVFELDISRKKLAELLGPGFDDSTIGTWEKKLHMPHDTAGIARRYREVARELGKDISADWLNYGKGFLVTFVTYADSGYLDLVTEEANEALRIPGLDLPQSRKEPTLALVE